MHLDNEEKVAVLISRVRGCKLATLECGRPSRDEEGWGVLSRGEVFMAVVVHWSGLGGV